LKKETIITAIVFLGVGFLAGYIYDAHQRSAEPAAVAAAPSAASPAGAPGDPAGMGGLPPGHPPINIDSTVKALEEQAAQNPKDPQPPLMLANALYDHQRFQEAAEWYEKALALDPKNVNARTDLGTVYFSLGRPQDALAAYRQSLKIDPNHQPTIFNTIIVNLEGTHDVAAARAAWEKLHGMNPNYTGLDSLKQRLDAAN
jgi:TPR repeat protein